MARPVMIEASDKETNMLIKLYGRATTIPKVRAAIQASPE